MNGDKQIKSTDWLTKGYTKEELATMKAEAIKEAEIEEMAKDFCAVGMPCEECHLYKNRCHAKKYATRAYNAGYRKASDVAEEIFAEIEQELLSAIDNNLQRMAEQEEANEIWRMCVAKKNTLCGIYDFIAELKKKYAEEEG